MKAFYFRFLDADGKATGWVGLVVGQTMDKIFDCIDEYGDPYTVQIQAAKKGGFCVQWKLFDDDSGDAVFDIDDGWVTPPWSLQ